MAFARVISTFVVSFVLLPVTVLGASQKHTGLPTTTSSTGYQPTSTCDTEICVDMINECGMMYGGCFLIPECGGTEPTFTPPPCPSSTPFTEESTTTSDHTTEEPSSTNEPSSTARRQCPRPVCDDQDCADYYNDCGEWYGGCYLAPSCGGVVPTFTPPPCITITDEPNPTPEPCTSDIASTCTTSICYDFVDDCGNWYGGCGLAPECGGSRPTFTTPSCEPTPVTVTPPPSGFTSYPSWCLETSTLCTDRYNPCHPADIGTCILHPSCGGTTLEPVNTVCSSMTLPPSGSSSYPTWCLETSTLCTDRYNPCHPADIGTCILHPSCGGTTLEPVDTVCSSVTTVTWTGGEMAVTTEEATAVWTTTMPEETGARTRTMW